MIGIGMLYPRIPIYQCDKPWNWDKASTNPRIKMRDIIRNPHWQWRWAYLLENPSISIRNILENPDLPWNWEFIPAHPLSYGSQIDIDILVNNPEWGSRLYDTIIPFCSMNPGITLQDILKYPDFNWPFTFMVHNPNITIQDISDNFGEIWNTQDTKNYGLFRNLCAYSISRNPNITLPDILRNSDNQWEWEYLTIAPGITIQGILNNPKLPWDLDKLSQNPNLTMMDILEKPRFNWNWDDISKNPGIGFRDILNNLDLPWNWGNISLNPRITIEDIQSNPDLPWVYPNISKNMMKHDKYFDTLPYRERLSREMTKITQTDEYIAKVFNPNRMRSYMSIQELEDLRDSFGWSIEEFNTYIK